MSTMIRPRRPVFALLMSLVLPGYGQLYNGQPNRAIWFFLAYCTLLVPALVAIALYVPSGLMMPLLVLGLCLSIALWVCGMTDAWQTARQLTDYVPRPWQTSGLYALVAIVCVLIVQPVFTMYARNHAVEPFRVPSTSMEPTLMHGDFIFADKRYNCPNCKQAVRRGDIAIFTYPNNRTQYYVKRIIGLPGEHVQITGREVLIDGRGLGRPESREGDGEREWQVRWSDQTSREPIDVTVPPGQVFVLGDNRDQSADSRKFGTVSLQDVVGRVRQAWFSYADGGVRWQRLGRVIE